MTNENPDFNNIINQFDAHDQVVEMIVGTYRSVKNRLITEGMPDDFADEASKQFVLAMLRQMYRSNPQGSDQ